MYLQVRTPFSLEGQIELEGGSGGGWVLVKPKIDEPILAPDVSSLFSLLSPVHSALAWADFSLLQVMRVLG